MRMRRILGLALAAATLVGVSAVGAGAASSPNISPNISRDDCTAAGGQIVARPYAGYVCTLPDGTTQAIT
ncbi:MAG: hypothetical protein JF597_10690 [Streptomyces sp.]|uniref:hypothetical protein n=1 Tax=Streptomyces sp. TaxID=1931 RepID=UPI0025F32D8C|nr:hypothetical protein [Streptomyces sp.]MBW8794034.1 hypothetical protein [Streptomyces sp.]